MILDKGLVVDAFVRVSLVGIEILTIEARIVIASVDTYLRFAEAVNRLDIVHDSTSQGLPEQLESVPPENVAKSKVKGLAEGSRNQSRATNDDSAKAPPQQPIVLGLPVDKAGPRPPSASSTTAATAT